MKAPTTIVFLGFTALVGMGAPWARASPGPASGAARGEPAATSGRASRAPVADGAGATSPEAQIRQRRSRAWSAAELGFLGSVIAEGTTFLGPVITVQGGHIRPLVGVFQVGLGVALYRDPIPDQVLPADDPSASPTERNAMFYVGMGLRLRVFQLIASLKERPFDLYVGPLVMVFGNKDLVTFGAAGELGFAVRFRRLRLSLSAHGGYQTVMHQYAVKEEYRFKATFILGGILSAGLSF